MNTVLKFKEAVPHLDLEADTYFILMFDSKDPDQMTTIVQGDVVKLSAAMAIVCEQVKDDAMQVIAEAQIEKMNNEPKVVQIKH